jgi:hypothetical protein
MVLFSRMSTRLAEMVTVGAARIAHQLDAMISRNRMVLV